MSQHKAEEEAWGRMGWPYCEGAQGYLRRHLLNRYRAFFIYSLSVYTPEVHICLAAPTAPPAYVAPLSVFTEGPTRSFTLAPS